MATDQHDDTSMPRRDFLKKSVVTAGAIGAAGSAESPTGSGEAQAQSTEARAEVRRPMSSSKQERDYNGPYTGDYLDKIAFPMGGIGAGMICLEGTGALSHLSIRNKPEVFNEPCIFAAICVKGEPNVARVLEGPLPTWKIFGPGGTGNGATGKTYGLPRFHHATFQARFPFATIQLSDDKVALDAEITGWSPFEPGDPDHASMPVAALEYKFTNPGSGLVEAVFSFNAKNFMDMRGGKQGVRPIPGGFVFWETGPEDRPWERGAFAARVTDPDAKVNPAWFRGGWWDSLTMAWNDVERGACYEQPEITEGGSSPGGTIFVPMKLGAGESKTVTLQMAWYVDETDQRFGENLEGAGLDPDAKYRPWYANEFPDIDNLSVYWRDNYDTLRKATQRFSHCFYDSTLPAEVIEAVAANLTILKSPTVLREHEGRLWCWEGCHDDHGCCHGSCTHVWNYAQAICHLFPSLERTLRETEFTVSQDDRGHQVFRTPLPIRPTTHGFHAASDGQLGGIMKVHREWRISGDTNWLRKLWPEVKESLDYCIQAWDPGHKGVLEEPHHNTYDIEFWGPDGMCTSFYLGALLAASKMAEALGDDDARSKYSDLFERGTKFVEENLYNGEYYYQQVKWEGLQAENPLKPESMVGHYSPEAIELFKKEGPKYQYGTGCISDGVLGAWIALVCGVGEVLDQKRVASHVKSVHKYNLKHDLSDHANPQRPSFACGNDGGLLLCSWPHGDKPSLPFVYSDEVWTGIEYQVASHLMFKGLIEEGLEIVRVARDRYDGRIRNPFNEYECGHWYARAMSSYGMLQGLTGVRYDAIDKVLYVEPTIPGDFRTFLATATGYGTVSVANGKASLDVRHGTIDVSEIKYTPKA